MKPFPKVIGFLSVVALAASPAPCESLKLRPPGDRLPTRCPYHPGGGTQRSSIRGNVEWTPWSAGESAGSPSPDGSYWMATASRSKPYTTPKQLQRYTRDERQKRRSEEEQARRDALEEAKPGSVYPQLQPLHKDHPMWAWRAHNPNGPTRRCQVTVKVAGRCLAFRDNPNGRTLTFNPSGETVKLLDFPEVTGTYTPAVEVKIGGPRDAFFRPRSAAAAAGLVPSPINAKLSKTRTAGRASDGDGRRKHSFFSDEPEPIRRYRVDGRGGEECIEAQLESGEDLSAEERNAIFGGPFPSERPPPVYPQTNRKHRASGRKSPVSLFFPQ